MVFPYILLLAAVAGLTVSRLIITARSLPRLKVRRRPRLFLFLAKETSFFNALLSCWNASLTHTQYLVLPKATTFKDRDSGAILRKLYKTFHPAQIIAQMHKIGHSFLKPLSRGRKRVFLKRVIKAVEYEVPGARRALKIAYWKTRWFAKWNPTVHDFFRHFHLEVEKDGKLQPQIKELWHNCSLTILDLDAEKMFLTDRVRPQAKTNKNKHENSLNVTDVNSNVRLIRYGLVGGIWYIRHASEKSVALEMFAKPISSIPDLLNHAEATNFGLSMKSESLITGETYVGFGGFPVAYLGSEIYRQYLLLRQDQTDIKTSLTFIAIDTAGGGAIIAATVLAKQLGVATAGAGFLIYKGVRMIVGMVKEKIFKAAEAVYRKFLKKREKALFKASSKMMTTIDSHRDKIQDVLDNHPHNKAPNSPNNEIISKFKSMVIEEVYKDIVKLDRFLDHAKNIPVSSFSILKSIMISYRLREANRNIRKIISFYEDFSKSDDLNLPNVLRKHWLLPISKSSKLCDDGITEINAMVKYNHYYLLGMSNRVFSLYGLLQQAFANLVDPIDDATRKYDEVAKSWISKTKEAHRRFSSKAAQVGKTISQKNNPNLLWSYRKLLRRENGKWTY